MKIIYDEKDIQQIVETHTRTLLGKVNIISSDLKTYPMYHCEVVIGGGENNEYLPTD